MSNGDNQALIDANVRMARFAITSFPDDVTRDAKAAAYATESTGNDASAITSLIGVEVIDRAIMAERERCAKLIEEGFDRPIGETYADDGKTHSKNDKCPHGRYMYEDCELCCAVAIRRGEA